MAGDCHLNDADKRLHTRCTRGGWYALRGNMGLGADIITGRTSAKESI